MIVVTGAVGDYHKKTILMQNLFVWWNLVFAKFI